MASTDATINIRANFDANQMHRDAERAMIDVERRMANRKSAIPNYTTNFNDFQRSIDAAATRVFSFGATAATFLTVKRAIVELVKSTIEVEKAMADVNVVLNLSSTNLATFRREIFNVAKDTGQTFKTVSSAAVELSRQGLGAAETQKRLRDAMILTRLAGLEAGASVEALTATINSFSNSIIDSTELVSKFARVDAAFAVSSKDFAEAIKRVGSTAEDAGVDINQLIGLVTSLQQATGRGGANIGQSLKTLLTRPQRSGIIEELEKVGITVRDGNGNLLQMVEILDRVEDSFKRLGKQDQSRITELLGSLYQINQLRSLLKDLGRDSSSSVYGRATRMAEGSSGNEAILRSLELNKTLSAQVNRLAVNAKQFLSDIGDVGLGGGFKNWIDIFNETLEMFANRDSTNIGTKIGEGIIKGIGNAITGPLGLGVFALLTKAAVSVFKNLFKAIESYNNINQSLNAQQVLVQSLNTSTLQRLGLEQGILGTIQAQNAARAQGGVGGMGGAIGSTFPTLASNAGGLLETPLRFGSTSSQSPGPMTKPGAGLDASFGSKMPNYIYNTKNRIEAIDRNIGAYQQSYINLGMMSFPEHREEQIDRQRQVARKLRALERLKSRLQNKLGTAENISNVLSPDLSRSPLIGGVPSGPDSLTEARTGSTLRMGARQEWNDKLFELRKRDAVEKAMREEARLALINKQQNQLDELKKRDVVERRAMIGGRVAWGAMLGGPILGGAYGSSFDTSTRGGRVRRAASEGVGNAIGYAGLGFALAPQSGPIVPIIGAAVGGILTLTNVFKEFNTVLPEVTRGMEEAKDAFARSQERGTKVAQLAEMASNIREGTMKPTSGNISNWMKMFRGTTMGSGMSKEITEAIFSGNPERIAAVQESISREPAKAKALQDLGGLFQGLIGSDSSTVGYVTSAFSELAGNISDEDRSALGGIFGVDKTNKFSSAMGASGAMPGGMASTAVNWNPIVEFLRKRGMNSPLLLQSLKELSLKNPAQFKRVIQGLAAKPDINTNAIEERLRGLAPGAPLGHTISNPLAFSRSSSRSSLLNMQANAQAEARINAEQNAFGAYQTANQTELAMFGLSATPSQFETRKGTYLSGEARYQGGLDISDIRKTAGGSVIQLGGNIRSVAKDWGDSFGEFDQDANSIEELGRRMAMGDTKAGTDLLTLLGKPALGYSRKSLSPSFSWLSNTPSIDGTGVGMRGKISGNETREVALASTYDQLEIITRQSMDAETERAKKTKSLTDSIDQQTKTNAFMVSTTAKAMEAVNSYKTSLDELIERNRQMSASGTLFSDEIASGNLEGRFAGIRRGSLGSSDMTAAMGASFSDQLAFGVKDLYRDLIQGAADVGAALKMSFKDAFRTFLDGSESAGAALRNLGLSFANKLLDIAASGTTNMLFGGLQSLGAAAFMPKFGPGFAAGGYVGGGSGIRDDVPAMLSEGDFVLRKSAVSKYGVGRLAALNFAGGGGVNFTPSSPLSNFALSDENNPQNQLRMEKEASDLNALLQYSAAKSAFDAAKRQRRLGALINLGVGLGAAGISYGASSLANANMAGRAGLSRSMAGQAWGAGALDAPGGWGRGFMGAAASGGLMTHNGVQRFAGGGSVDNVPALLTGGEFVMNRNAVARHGVGFMHRLNRGEVPGFNNGGFVGETIEGGGTGRSEVNFGDSISRLINSNEKLRSVMEKGGTVQEGSNQSASQLVGSISINVHVDSGGNARADVQTEGANNQSNNNQAERGAQIADLIKSTVLETLNKESRNGGVLEQNFQRRR